MIKLNILRGLISALGVGLTLSCHNSHVGSPADMASRPRVNSGMPDSLKKEIIQEIKMLVDGGFYENIDLSDHVFDMYYKEALDTLWVLSAISHAYDDKLADQRGWPALTDFDRLAQVFDQLCAEKVIALHNAGNTRDEGEDDAGGIRDSLQGQGIRCKGYCFYHSQDVDRAIEGHRLYLAFGSFAGDKKEGERIGRRIVDLLKEKGFHTKWDGSLDNRIEVSPIDWKKRFGNNQSSYEHAKTLLARP